MHLRGTWLLGGVYISWLVEVVCISCGLIWTWLVDVVVGYINWHRLVGVVDISCDKETGWFSVTGVATHITGTVSCHRSWPVPSVTEFSCARPRRQSTQSTSSCSLIRPMWPNFDPRSVVSSALDNSSIRNSINCYVWRCNLRCFQVVSYMVFAILFHRIYVCGQLGLLLKCGSEGLQSLLTRWS